MMSFTLTYDLEKYDIQNNNGFYYINHTHNTMILLPADQIELFLKRRSK